MTVLTIEFPICRALVPSFSLPIHSSTAGKALPRALEARLFALFSVDLSRVKTYVGAHVSARGMRAFAHGTDLHFAPGALQPSTEQGFALIVHELVHCFQQAHLAKELEARAGMGADVRVLDDPALEAQAEFFAQLACAAPLQASVEFAKAFPGLTALRPSATTWRWIQANIHVEVGGRDIKLTDAPRAMMMIAAGIRDGQVASDFLRCLHQIRPVLAEWISASRELWKRWVSGRPEHTVRYKSWDNLARSLLGEVRSAGNKQIEAQLARETKDSEYIKTKLAEYLTFVRICLDKPWNLEIKGRIFQRLGYKGDYSHWYPIGGIAKILKHPEDCKLQHQIAAIHDIVDAFRRTFPNYYVVPDDKCVASSLQPRKGRGYQVVKTNMKDANQKLTFRVGDLNDRDTTLEESSEIIRSYRDADMPVGFGPSFTTGRTLQCCAMICEENGKRGEVVEFCNAIAWGLFAFWNLYYERRYSRCHTFHEAMDMASNYGVPYVPFEYPVMCPTTGNPYPYPVVL
jgi:Domain of unknown function (DUF4157)